MPLWDAFMVEKDLYVQDVYIWHVPNCTRSFITTVFPQSNTTKTYLECPLGQNLSTLPSSPIGQALKQRFESLKIDTLLLHQRKAGWRVLAAMVSSQKMTCLRNEARLSYPAIYPMFFFFRTEVNTKYSLRLSGGSFQLSKAKTELCSFSNTFISLDSESRSRYDLPRLM